jgi:hypothetical protein
MFMLFLYLFFCFNQIQPYFSTKKKKEKRKRIPTYYLQINNKKEEVRGSIRQELGVESLLINT